MARTGTGDVCINCVQYQHKDYLKPFPPSVQKHDYRTHCDADPPDRVTPRRAKLLQQRGALPTDLFFRHHGKSYDCNRITCYDEVYNGRRVTDAAGAMRFPDTRHWAMKVDASWKPEHSDYPLQG